MEKALTTLSGPTQQLVKEAMLRQQHLLEEQRAQDHTVQQGKYIKKLKFFDFYKIILIADISPFIAGYIYIIFFSAVM
jgi:hypothetical protein